MASRPASPSRSSVPTVTVNISLPIDLTRSMIYNINLFDAHRQAVQVRAVESSQTQHALTAAPAEVKNELPQSGELGAVPSPRNELVMEEEILSETEPDTQHPDYKLQLLQQARASKQDVQPLKEQVDEEAGEFLSETEPDTQASWYQRGLHSDERQTVVNASKDEPVSLYHPTASQVARNFINTSKGMAANEVIPSTDSDEEGLSGTARKISCGSKRKLEDEPKPVQKEFLKRRR